MLYDLAVIGSGPAGQKAAMAAAKLGKRVAVVDRREMIGGVCIHTGTIPSKALREAILYLSGFRQRTVLRAGLHPPGSDLGRGPGVAGANRPRPRDRGGAQRSSSATASRRCTAPLASRTPTPSTWRRASGRVAVAAERILIACGTRPAHGAGIPFDGQRVIDSDQLLSATGLPKQMIVVGAGVIGLEYASMLTTLGEHGDGDRSAPDDPRLRRRGDRRGALLPHAPAGGHLPPRRNRHRGGASTRAGGWSRGSRAARPCRATPCSTRWAARATPTAWASRPWGSRWTRGGAFPSTRASRPRSPHIYAAGDVIGFPSLASTSMEQGRLAACHMFGLPCVSRPELLPYGIYSVPEISMVGKTEQRAHRGPDPVRGGAGQVR